MITITLYHDPQSEESKAVLAMLQALKEEIPHQVVDVDISKDADLWKNYQKNQPMVEVGPFRLHYPFEAVELRVAMGAARDRKTHLEKVGDKKYSARYERARTLTRTDRFSLWLSRNYIWFFNLVVGLFVGLPFLAPVFMEAGIDLPAKIIYKVYSPLCHQFAFRSWFLFGEQASYPREITGIKNVISYEQLSQENPIDLKEARNFIGNPATGYKVALCERDVAIYGGILLFGVLFAISGRKLKSLPWYFWVIFGILPMGIDGASQLPSLMNLNLPLWIPLRESTPFLRTLTGGLFGISTAWYGYPLIEDTMRETKRILNRKLAVIEKTQEAS